jgi:putative component of membrane protein insertase Oxa1/YidC/SpoIIIJ protein YidD
MKWFLVVCIRSYRRLPVRFKRRCLFKENCSSFVERVTLESGMWAGLKALSSRASKCQPGYSAYYDLRIDDWRVCLRDGSIFRSAALADFCFGALSLFH